MPRHPAVAYVAPFAVFIALLVLKGYVAPPEPAGQLIWILCPAAALWLCSRRVIDLRVRRPLLTLCVGVAVFLVWIGPDALWPGYRQHWLFSNSLTGSARSSLGSEALSDPLVLALRVVRAVLLVPILEELFWRGWLMRWLIRPDFDSVAPGTYSAQSFWMVAVLFAAEHGPYWDVGLVTGIAYNWWMLRTRNLGDLIAAHAVTNAGLCVYVLSTGRWEYWL